MRRDRVIPAIDRPLDGRPLIELTEGPNNSRDADHLEECPDLELAQRIARAEAQILRRWAER